jgi:thioesterase domain-containing protein/acyl carrier protein
MSDRAVPTQSRPLIDTLIEIWEGVLGRSPIYPEDNFFELGGDSLLAVALFLAIEEATGRRLPITTIYDAATVMSLTRVLEQVSEPPSSPLVVLKHGSGAPPVFLAAGAGARVMSFSQFVKHLPSNRPVYGLEDRGLDGIHPLYDGIEHMAEAYCAAVQIQQAHGPYFLAGHSSGGLVMLEVAHRLMSRGEQIALLLFLDTYPHPQFWRLAAWIAVMKRLLLQQIATAPESGIHDILLHLLRRCRNLLKHIRIRYDGAYHPRNIATYEMIPAKIQKAFDAGLISWAHYEPRFFPGKITFLKAEIVAGYWPADPHAVWGKLARCLEIHTVPGDHNGMLADNVENLGAQFSLCLERAFANSNRLAAGIARTPCRPPVDHRAAAPTAVPRDMGGQIQAAQFGKEIGSST